MSKSKLIIYTILENKDFSLIPYNPNPDKESKKIFQQFDIINKNSLYQFLLNNYKEFDDENIQKILITIRHYKGFFEYFDDTISFEKYRKINSWLDNKSKNKFKVHFFREYGISFINDEIFNIDDELIDLILINDPNLYIKIAKKLNIEDAGKKIFENHPTEIYNWLNYCNNMYNELLKLNQPSYILKNMNGQLNITDDSLKYIIEYSEPSLELYKSIKKRVGLKKLWEISNQKINSEILFDLIESLNDLIFIINIDNLELKTLEFILNRMKDKFPNIYNNLNPLIFVKIEFNNK